MSLLSSVMSSAAAAQRSAAAAAPGLQQRPQAVQEKEDPREKENRLAYRKLLDNALKEGNTQQIEKLSPEAMSVGIDVTPYRVAAGAPSRDQKLSRALDQTLAEKLGFTEPGQKAPDNPLNDPAGPALDLQGATPQEPIQDGMVPPELKKHMDELFTPDFTQRMLAKKVSGIDIGEHYGEEAGWYDAYKQMKKANPNMPSSKIVENITMQTGWMPDSAGNLRDLSVDEKNQISETTFGKYYNDPVLRESISKLYPKADADKAMAGFVLHGMRGEGYAVPERLQPFLDRFDGLNDEYHQMDSDKIAREVKAKGYAQEEVEAATFGGKFNRQVAVMQATKEIKKPKVTAAVTKAVAGGKTFLDTGMRAMDVIAGFTGLGPDADISKLPTGKMEYLNRLQDDWGIMPNEQRIKLRTSVAKFLETMYEVRGKQMSDKEVALAQALQPAMTESPTAFISKFSDFQQSIVDGTLNTIAAEKAAGRETTELEVLVEDLKSMPNIKTYLGLEDTADKKQQQKQAAPDLGVSHQSTVPADKKNHKVLSGDSLKTGKVYQDADGNKATYMGNGQWQILNQ